MNRQATQKDINDKLPNTQREKGGLVISAVEEDKGNFGGKRIKPEISK